MEPASPDAATTKGFDPPATTPAPFGGRVLTALRVPAAAFAGTLLVFGIFMMAIGRNPVAIYQQM